MLSFEVPLPPVDSHMCKIKCKPRGTEHLNGMCKIVKGSYFDKNSSYNSVKVFLTIDVDFQDTNEENSFYGKRFLHDSGSDSDDL